MKYFIYSSLFNALTSILCCVLVYFSKNKTKTSNAFFIFALFVALWSGFYFFSITSSDYSFSLWLARFVNLAALFIPISFFYFCCCLLNKYQEFHKLIKLSYIFNIVFIPITLTPLYVINVKPALVFQYWPQAGSLYFILILEYIYLVGLALIELYKKLKNSINHEEKKMLQFVFYGLLIGFSGGSTNFPLLYNLHVLPVGNILVSFYTFGVMYAIFKYKFMDISVVLKRSLIYSILISLITLFYFVSIYVLENFFKELFGYKSFLFSLISATIIATIFIPLKNFIQNFIEKTLFKGTYTEIAEENELLRQEIIQTERLKAVATLASGMAHEIKNPLTILKTFSEYLPQKLENKEFLKKFAPMIAQEVTRIDNLVHELLDFAKPANPVLKPVNLHSLINSTLELLSNDCLKYNIKIEKDFHIPEQTSLPLDYNQMKQALLNIFLNALDAMKNGGQLYISTFLENDIIHIKIQDSGTGINPHDLPHIFDPFFSKKDSGTGLGLSITYEIIKKHGGKIFAESILGKGTTFILELSSA